MENRPLGPEEQDENTESTNTKKKRGSKLSNYLSSLRGREASSHTAGEGQEAEKPKRMQRLFARLFPGIVEKPAHLSTDMPEQQHEFNHDVWANITRFASRIEQGQQGVGEQQDDDDENVNVSTRPTPSLVAAPTQPAASDTNPAHHTSERIMDAAPIAEETVPDAPSLPLDNGEVTIDFGQQDRQPTVDSLPTEKKVPTETVIERRGSNLLPIALVGAEYVGRKRADKKLEARTNKKIDAFKKEQDHGSALQKELEKVVSENKQQIEQLKKARSTMESQVSDRGRIPALESRTTPSERKESPRQEVRGAPERTSPQETSDKVAQSSEVVRPNNIAEQVAEAAEHDVPVERAFERSHEVKDDKSHPVAAAGAASVGSVVAASTAAGMAASSKVAGSDNAKDLPFVSDEAAREFYRRAAARGFWAAICLIVLGTIAYLVVKY